MWKIVKDQQSANYDNLDKAGKSCIKYKILTNLIIGFQDVVIVILQDDNITDFEFYVSQKLCICVKYSQYFFSQIDWCCSAVFDDKVLLCTVISWNCNLEDK